VVQFSFLLNRFSLSPFWILSRNDVFKGKKMRQQVVLFKIFFKVASSLV
jgi:hypothetical protein